MSKLRRPGSPWRLLAHRWIGGRRPDGIQYGDSYHVDNSEPAGIRTEEHALGDIPFKVVTYSIPGTEFDELVVGRWLHIEQMDSTLWWMNIGGVTVHVVVDRDGRAKAVTVHAAGDYADPVPGCTYHGAVAP